MKAKKRAVSAAVRNAGRILAWVRFLEMVFIRYGFYWIGASK
jgi:hypothetical protein